MDDVLDRGAAVGSQATTVFAVGIGHGGGGSHPGGWRPIEAAEPARLRACVAGVPVTAACGSAAVGAPGRCTTYVPPRSASSVNVASLVAGTTTRSGRRPSTTSTGAPGHGLRIRIPWSEPDSIATVVISPSWTWTCTFERCWRKTVPSASHPGGSAGAMRRIPSKSCTSDSLIASAVTPACSS